MRIHLIVSRRSPVWFPTSTMIRAPIFGDFIVLRDIQDQKLREEKYLRLIKSISLVHVHGGQINADVSGSSVGIE